MLLQVERANRIHMYLSEIIFIPLSRSRDDLFSVEFNYNADALIVLKNRHIVAFCKVIDSKT